LSMPRWLPSHDSDRRELDGEKRKGLWKIDAIVVFWDHLSVSFDELFNATFLERVGRAWHVCGIGITVVMEARGVGMTIDRAGRKEGEIVK
jgi:hypothetical protein